MTRSRVVNGFAVVGAGLIVVMVAILYFASEAPKITPGQTVTDPGVLIMHYSDSRYLGREEIVYSVANWHEIAESERPWTTSPLMSPTEPRIRIIFLDSCDHQTGAKITALEQFENEVLVKYSNPERKKDSYNCPSGVVFWMSTEDFQKADSQYQEVMEIKAEQEEADRKAKDKKQRKLEVVRRHVSPPPDAPTPSPA